MGAAGSKAHRLERALGAGFPENEHVFGLENFGNTCYCNSVLQALFYCQPLRDKCLEYRMSGLAQDGNDDGLLTSLCELFFSISSQKKRCGVLAPRQFISKLRAENELFNNHMHQDAHEFLNYLLNEVAEQLEKNEKAKSKDAAGNHVATGGPSSEWSARVASDSMSDDEEERQAAYQCKTWIHSIFEGVLTNDTRCLSCETVTSREESFLDLSLEIEQDSSLNACMRNFSSIESLRGDNKFFCDNCCSLQEAKKRMRIKRLPNVLALHLKRFKYIEQLGRFKKLSYKVAFPLELELDNIASDMPEPDRRYRLFAVIVHMGSGPNHGHYFALVRSHQHWLCFDDDSVDIIEESQIESCFGNAQETQASTETGYLLFYQSEASILSSHTDSDSQISAENSTATAATANNSPSPSPSEKIKGRIGPKVSVGVKRLAKVSTPKRLA